VAPLQGIGVLVTRPEQQAMRLCDLLHAQGASTLRLPAIEIKPCAAGLEASRARIGTLAAFDLIVFTSANAVRFGSALLGRSAPLPLAAIGPATARALRQHGYDVALQPQAGFTSEALLAHPRLENLCAQRILLIKGAHGREQLEQEFTRRGAHVLAIDVYRRLPASPSDADLAEVEAEFQAGRMHIITATSLDIGKRLLDIVGNELRADFQRAHWLVPGTRVAAGLRERGLHAPLIMASSAEDQDLVEALLRWRSSESGA
jgi:uroporphyrinogen-III synthase